MGNNPWDTYRKQNPFSVWHPTLQQWHQQVWDLWGVVDTTEMWAAWWWFNSKNLMPPGNYRVKLSEGISWIGVNAVDPPYDPVGVTTSPRGWNLSYRGTGSAATQASWRYVAVVQSADLTEKPTAYSIHPDDTEIYNGDGVAARDAVVQHYIDAYSADASLGTFATTKQAYIGIALLVDMSPTYLPYNFDRFSVRNSSFFQLFNYNQIVRAWYANYPRYTLTPCANCAPESVTNEAYKNSTITLSWKDPSACYDRHDSYFKEIDDCADCADTDPSIDPTFALTTKGGTEREGALPISNSDQTSGLASGKYCYRIDAVKVISDCTDGSTSEIVAKGDVHCIDVDCGAAPYVKIESPADQSAFATRTGLAFSIKYSHCDKLILLFGTEIVAQATVVYDTAINTHVFTDITVPWSVYIPPCPSHTYVTFTIMGRWCGETTATATYDICSPTSPGGKCIASWTTQFGLPVRSLPSSAGTNYSTWELIEQGSGITYGLGIIVNGQLINIPATFTPPYYTHVGYMCLRVE